MEIYMCGIMGYTGTRESLPVLLAGLKALEYRGYDSAGVTVQGTGLVTVKSHGKISELEEKLSTDPPTGTCGIGHTRWATHGEPSDVNAHPHVTEHLSLVHNGIIENEAELGRELQKLGYTFVSATDTEKAVDLLDHCFAETGDPVKATLCAVKKLTGSYAFGVIFADYPGKIYAIRKDSPLIVACADDGCYLASDVTAILPYSRDYFRPPEGVVAELDGSTGELRFFDAPGHEVTFPTEHVDWSTTEAQKGGFTHYMLKEIHEEPETIRRTVATHLADGLPHFGCELLDSEELAHVRRIHLVACGTAMHAGLIGKHLMETWARIPAEVSLASEFRYRDPILSREDLVILISQSGETSDTLAALRHAKACGVRTLGVVNVPGSAIAREADDTVYTLAGPEIAVASTKAYSVQCAVMCLLAVRLALLSGKITEYQARGVCRLLHDAVPAAVNDTLALSDALRLSARSLISSEHLFYIGRNIDWALCAEASLKLKEISYLHSEAYAAGELKHGTISLVTEGVPVIALMTAGTVAEKMISGIREVLSRGADVIAVASEKIAREYDIPCRHLIRIPDPVWETEPVLPESLTEAMALFPAATALQLLAYHASDLRGLDVDQPRNLAKSVTVE